MSSHSVDTAAVTLAMLPLLPTVIPLATCMRPLATFNCGSGFIDVTLANKLRRHTGEDHKPELTV